MCSYYRSRRSYAFYHDQHLLHDPVRPHKVCALTQVRGSMVKVNGSHNQGNPGAKQLKKNRVGVGGGGGGVKIVNW